MWRICRSARRWAERQAFQGHTERAIATKKLGAARVSKRTRTARVSKRTRAARVSKRTFSRRHSGQRPANRRESARSRAAPVRLPHGRGSKPLCGCGLTMIQRQGSLLTQRLPDEACAAEPARRCARCRCLVRLDALPNQYLVAQPSREVASSATVLAARDHDVHPRLRSRRNLVHSSSTRARSACCARM